MRADPRMAFVSWSSFYRKIQTVPPLTGSWRTTTRSKASPSVRPNTAAAKASLHETTPSSWPLSLSCGARAAVSGHLHRHDLAINRLFIPCDSLHGEPPAGPKTDAGLTLVRRRHGHQRHRLPVLRQHHIHALHDGEH